GGGAGHRVAQPGGRAGRGGGLRGRRVAGVGDIVPLGDPVWSGVRQSKALPHPRPDRQLGVTISDHELSLPWLTPPRSSTHSFQVPRRSFPLKWRSGRAGCQAPVNGPRPKPMYCVAWSSKRVPDRLAEAPPMRLNSTMSVPLGAWRWMYRSLTRGWV